ncbi:DUF2141 domain-containing protein [Flavobacterium sandaracinum]|uniref:DUF2141 domain-containing protein n=1 Tax=Flavobacterium sandaracinum TaxID=2541733 RepID=A0A4R5CUG6_9FLAO|nr:DUF2141 domain-containing protein [Flavobacterium sandaracinum]
MPDEKFNRYYKKESTTISNNSSSAAFFDLLKGNYAVFILNDENKNSDNQKNYFAY